jgi:hypothetical protein
MPSPTIIRIAVTGALGLHALAHGNGVVALVQQAFGAEPALPARLWAVAALDPRLAAVVALPLWIAACAAFAAAAMSFWGIKLPLPSWRQLCAGGAVASLAGVALYFGTWPGAPDRFYAFVDIAVAVAMNLAIVGALVLRRRTPQPMFGR